MKAVIHPDTEYEISWSIDDPITPELVKRIEDAGNELNVDWLDSKFRHAAELLLETWNLDYLIEKICDEDPNIIEIIALSIQNPILDHHRGEENVKIIARLYLPVVIIILKNL